MKTMESNGGQAIAGVLLVVLILGALVFAPLALAHDGGIEQGIDADTVRYTAMGQFYQDSMQRGRDADAARYAALGRYFTDPVAAGIDQQDLLAANPELMVAHRYSSAAAQAAAELHLAANPELMIAHRYSLAAHDALLAANPELISHFRYQTCGC